MFRLTKREQVISIASLIIIIALSGMMMINNHRTNEDGIRIGQDDEVSATPTHNQGLITQEKEEEVKTIAVHVKGQVKNPGIVYLEEGKRVNDVLEAAGGVLETADLDAINLAAYVQDGQEIYVPAKGEIAKLAENAFSSPSQVQNPMPSNKTNSANKKININTASAKELEELPGIGAAIAQRIVDYRNQNGPFSDIEEIQNVSGIGSSRFNQIKDLIDVR